MIHLSRSAIVNELYKAKDKDGLIQPEIVVEQATPPTAPLHSAFEWDDAKAAHHHRVEQARGLIRTSIVYEEGERKTYSLSSDRKTNGGYRDTSDVLSSPEMRRIAVADALVELQSWRNRHQHLTELKAIFGVIDVVSVKEGVPVTSKRRAPKIEAEKRLQA